MANAVVSELESLTFDGTDLQRSDLSLHLDVASGLWEPAEVRGEDSVVPGLIGRIPRNRVRDRRVIVLSGIVQGTGTDEAARLASFTGLMDELGELFATDQDVTLSAPVLSGTAWDGSTRSIPCRPVSMLPGPQVVPGFRTVVVTLEAVEPDWSGGGS